jgi:hypothetical protein
MATKAPTKAVKTAQNEPEAVVEYRMPTEVANWIRQAESRLAYLTTTVERLKAENVGLRKANKIMEMRVMGQSQE